MSSKPILYGATPSPPVRAVRMLAMAIDLDVEFKYIDFLNLEHKSEEYLKMNPTHTIPTLNDNGTFIWDSHAIMIYLVEKYSKNENLYPKDIVKRAKVNQLLFFDVSTFGKFVSIMLPIFMKGVKVVTEDQKETLTSAYESVERILKDKTYLTGDIVTIADISLVTTMTALDIIAPIDSKAYPLLAAWMKRMEGLVFYGPNAEGRKQQAEIIKKFI